MNRGFSHFPCAQSCRSSTAAALIIFTRSSFLFIFLSFPASRPVLIVGLVRFRVVRLPARLVARKNRTPEEKARREKIRELLQMANIGSMDDIQNLFKETIAEFMENGLEAELDDELGYSKYDYKNKDTDNSRNGHSSKTLRTSFGDVEVSVPRDRKGEFEPQVLKKNQTSISQDIEEKILSMYAKGMTTGDIETHIQDIYGISVSDSTVSRII